MYLKRYTIAAFIWIALVGWYVYAYVTQTTVNIDFFGVPLPSLSVALWVVLPLVVLYLASVAHMAIYSMLGNFRLRKYDKDYEKIIDEIADTYLGKQERHYTFKTARYKLLGTLLENSIIYPKGDVRGKIKNEKIEKVIDAIETIKSGEVADLKRFNLRSDNELVIQNTRNMFKKGDLKAEDILSNEEKYSEDLRKEVYLEYIKTAPLANIEKYKVYLTKETLNTILSRINADENSLHIPNEDLVSLVENVQLDKKDFIQLSMQLANAHMIPEDRIKLFEVLSEKNEDAIDAYIFTLYDLGMHSPADAILDNSQKDEYQNFKAYRALKECGKNFNIDIFV
ncbi:hypothetical protein [Sulfurimonas sp.]|uniref:hypothetical protein n=1 Tax=Sulfurimonas sp. TaxID=2022749 RepID=UPI002625EDAE|nr:hypothetical protein [Sulfurimonas sp.]